MNFVANKKGGSGKTAMAVNLAAVSAKSGRTLLVDLDPQGSASSCFGVDDAGESLASFLSGGRTLDAAVHETDYGVDVLGGGEHLRVDAANFALAGVARAMRTIGKAGYANVFIDTPPDANALVLAAVAGASEAVAVIPVDGFDALRAVNRLRQVSDDARVRWARVRLVLSRHDPRRVLDRDLEMQARSAYGRDLMNGTIRETVALRESAAFRQPVISYAPHHAVTRDYENLFQELNDAA